MEQCSTLKLIIEKGPRSGETLEFKPGSIIRLGRVVRGNSVAIKDSGISTKHLSIIFDSSSSKWLITDLDSSNGTVLNLAKLDANVPYPLTDGDSVKIGESTSVIVKIESGIGVQLRRYATRRKVNGESSELGFDLGESVVEKPRRRGRVKKDRDLEIEVGRSLNDGEIAEKTRNDVDVMVKNETIEVENLKELENVGLVEVNQGRELRQRSTRSSTRVTRNSKKEESVRLGGINEDNGKEVESGVVNACKKGRKGRRKQNDVEDEVVKNSENEVLEEKEVEDDKDDEEKDVNCEVKDGNDDFKLEVDLEKMTLGEWFVFLEVYLPKQIYDETEEMISDMKQRAKQFHDYKIEKKHAMDKGKMPRRRNIRR